MRSFERAFKSTVEPSASVIERRSPMSVAVQRDSARFATTTAPASARTRRTRRRRGLRRRVGGVRPALLAWRLAVIGPGAIARGSCGGEVPEFTERHDVFSRVRVRDERIDIDACLPA